MSYCCFNRQESLQKAKDKYDNYGGQEEASDYYQGNDAIKEKAKDKHKNLSEEEKETKRKYSKSRYNQNKEKPT